MFVCMCYGVTDTQITRAVEAGVGNMRELKEHLSVGAQCGKCLKMAQQIIDSTIVDESLFRDAG